MDHHETLRCQMAEFPMLIFPLLPREGPGHSQRFCVGSQDRLKSLCSICPNQLLREFGSIFYKKKSPEYDGMLRDFEPNLK